jgi:hypothetical protein
MVPRGLLACDRVEGKEVGYIAVELNNVIQNVLGNIWS